MTSMTVLYAENMNYGRFETWSSRPAFDFYQVTQVHGTCIAQEGEADGMLFTWAQLDRPLAIKTADCLPVVIEGKKGVALIHAGWRGLAHGILEKEEIASIAPERALIGPSIHHVAFEVSRDFRDNFPQSPHFCEIDGKLHFDLQLEARDRLRKAFPLLLVEIAPICTFTNENFHSFRRNKTTSRNWNIYIKG